jgi:aspartate/methionine/tyrosine aminotransferase
MDVTSSMSQDDFSTRLARLRAAGVLRFDLTQGEPVWCGLGREEADADAHGRSSPLPRSEALALAREAVASYLAGHRVSVRPEHVFFAESRLAARTLAVLAVSRPDDDVLVPAPSRTLLEPVAAPRLRLRPYRLAFGEEWRLDRRSIRRALGQRTRALLVGNPAEPTGAMLNGEELSALDELCGLRGIALIGDEALLDTAVGASVSVARAERALAVHVSGLTGVCGLPGTAGEWIAVSGPEALAAPTAERLAGLTEARSRVPDAALRAIPALLARRGPYLAALRERMAKNRGAIAHAALREAPWSLLWGGGGPWAVLQINPIRNDRELCLELLDEGVAVQPGSLDGLPPTGHLVVSLLTEPSVLLAGLDRLERHLRGRA